MDLTITTPLLMQGCNPRAVTYIYSIADGSTINGNIEVGALVIEATIGVGAGVSYDSAASAFIILRPLRGFTGPVLCAVPGSPYDILFSGDFTASNCAGGWTFDKVNSVNDDELGVSPSGSTEKIPGETVAFDITWSQI